MQHHKLKNLASEEKKTQRKKDAVDTQHLFDAIQCLRKLSVMQYLGRSQIDITNILSFEITRFPGSLADKKDGLKRTGNNAELLRTKLTKILKNGL